VGLEDHHGEYHEHDHPEGLTEDLAAPCEAGELG
jgi:hypothetical protein